MLGKILSIPFFVIMLCTPFGLLMLLANIPVVDEIGAIWGEWSFKQWENKNEKSKNIRPERDA